MKNTKNRRSFLRKVAAATGAVFLPNIVVSSELNHKKMENWKIRNIKALGFQWETMDPFLFCVHHEDFYPKGNSKLGPDANLGGRQLGQDFMVKDGWRMYHGKSVPGFPGHPHRGFETITVVKKGLVDHSDSAGASGRYGNGDVQWMTAGKGLQHSEMFPLVNQKEENPMELFQIWLNLPSKGKFVEPHFKMLWADQIPDYSTVDRNGKAIKVEIVAGTLEEHQAPTPPPDSWANTPENEVAIWNIEMDAGAEWTLPKASNGINRTVYFFKGDELLLDDVGMKVYHSAQVNPTEKIVLRSGSEKASILILQGRPINEPVVQHGPFVMNSKQEIQEAFDDFQKTQFGGWPWPCYDHVHDKEQGRFARHADGSEEIPN
jgi:redox-sensitive bicupin YhaK (pirin superfamily)